MLVCGNVEKAEPLRTFPQTLLFFFKKRDFGRATKYEGIEK